MAMSTCGSSAIDRQGKELLEHGTALFPAACYRDDIGREPVPWHWHDEMEVLRVDRGSARICVRGKDCAVREGEGFFINAGVLHGIWPLESESCNLRSVVFHPRLVGGSVDSILWQKYLEPLRSDPCLPCVHFGKLQPWERDASEAILEAWLACAFEGEGFEFVVREQLSRLIFLLAKHCPAEERRPSEKALRDGERIKIMLQYIQENYAQELNLARIAQSAAVSENECLRCFRSMTGSTPIQYLRQLRIQRAAELLATTDRKISDIGAACGFQEMSYFAKIFREQKGDSPGAYRKRVRQGGAGD